MKDISDKEVREISDKEIDDREIDDREISDDNTGFYGLEMDVTSVGIPSTELRYNQRLQSKASYDASRGIVL